MTATADILSAPASHAEVRELARLTVEHNRRNGVEDDDALLALLLLAYQMGKRSRDRIERAS
jgi:hypothetical protein